MEFNFSINFSTEIVFVKTILEAKKHIFEDGFFIIDRKVLKYFPEIEAAENSFFVDGESDKEIETVLKIIEWLQKNNGDRKKTMYGIGGGAVTDLAAFVASIYMRGMRLCLIPTTLLSVVDSSFGGKTGVNFGAKNILGTIYPAEKIVVIKDILSSLPEEEKKNGAAEIIKAGFLDGGDLLKELISSADLLNESLLKKALEIKYKFIKNDLLDKEGKRVLLNFGHTIGHALEKFYKIPHGLAVAYGMVIEQKIGELKKKTFYNSEEIVVILKKYGIFLDNLKNYLKEGVWTELMKKDKKTENKTISVICLETPGMAKIVKVNFDEIKYLMEAML